MDASRINSSISAMGGMGAYSFAAAQRAYGAGGGTQATQAGQATQARPVETTPIAKIGDVVRAGQNAITRGVDSVSVASGTRANGVASGSANAINEMVSERLVAAVVPGRIDFSQEQPVQNTAGAMPFYRHPADKNSAATRIAVSTKIDLNA